MFPKNPTKYDKAEELAGKFEGDMDLTPEQMTAITRPNQRNGLINVTKRWPNNYVNYVISGNYSECLPVDFFYDKNCFFEKCIIFYYES